MHEREEPVEYWIDAACIGFEEDLVRLMEREQMTRADVARAYGASTAFISKVLNGSTNYTLKTMAKLGRSVRGVLQVRLIHEDDEVLRVLSFDQAELVDAIIQGERRPALGLTRTTSTPAALDEFTAHRLRVRADSASATALQTTERRAAADG